MPENISNKAKICSDSSSFPKFKKFIDKADEINNADGHEALRVLHEYFIEILQSNEVAALLNAELRTLNSDPLRKAAAFSSKSFAIYQNDAVLLSCVLFDQKNDTDIISSTHSVFTGGILSRDGALSMRRFALPPSWKDEVYDPGTVVKFVSESEYRYGESFSVDSPFDLVDFSAEKPILLLRMSAKKQSRFAWLFDKKSLTPLFFSSTSTGASRYETLIKVIGELYEKNDHKNNSLLEVLRFLTNHSLHNVRWMSTQVLFQLSPDDGIQVLKKVVNDDHPHVRAAAANSLERLRHIGMVA